MTDWMAIGVLVFFILLTIASIIGHAGQSFAWL